MQKPSRVALEAVYGYVWRELLPKMQEKQIEEKEKTPVSAGSKERRNGINESFWRARLDPESSRSSRKP